MASPEHPAATPWYKAWPPRPPAGDEACPTCGYGLDDGSETEHECPPGFRDQVAAFEPGPEDRRYAEQAMRESTAANEPDYGAIDVPATPTTDEEIAKLPVLDLDAHKASAARVYHVPASEMYDEPHPNWRTVEVVRVSDFEPAPPQPPGVPSPPKPSAAWMCARTLPVGVA